MGKFQSFKQFLATQSVQVPIGAFIINLILAATLSFILSKIYTKYGTTLSNRKMFANNFPLITMTTMLVIAIVKSSLALSLGLVGALSIVRFRAAIKEPEELAYLFLSIGIGLGFGADQRTIVLVAFVIINAVIIFRNYFNSSQEASNLYLTVSSSGKNKISLDQIVQVLKNSCLKLNMKRFDENKDILEAAFLIEFDTFEELSITKAKLQELDANIKLTFLDNKGIV